MPLSLFHLHGDLKEQPFPRLLAGLRSDRFTGVLQANTRVNDEPGLAPAIPPPAPKGENNITREIHFFEGHIAWAISTDPEESLKAYLLRNGAVTDQQWAEAEDAAGGGTLRQALVEAGPITARELSQLEKGRIEAIVLALFPAGEGEYRVRERQLPPGTPDLKLDPRPLLLKGMMEAADLSLIMEEVGSLDSVPVSARGARSDADASIPGEFQTILRHVDGRNSVAAIIAATGLPDNYVCTVVAALSMVGTIRRQPAGRTREEPTPPKAIETTATPPASLPIAAAPPPFLPLHPVITSDSTQAGHEEEPPGLPPGVPPGFPDDAVAEILPAMLMAVPAAVSAREEAPLPILQATVHMLAVASRLDQRVVGDADEDGESSVEIDEIDEIGEIDSGLDDPVAGAPPTANPVYGAAGDERSRPWFLLGGAAAVAFAALFLILMSHGGGDAVEYSPEAPPVPDASTVLVPLAEEPDEPENDWPAAGHTLDSSPANSGRPGIASPSAAHIFDGGSAGTRTGQHRLRSGDFAGAAELFRKEYRSSSDGYTIQLMAACRDESVERALKQAGGAGSLFILPARVAGKSCYRVYWGHYATASIAQEALTRDVPSVFRRDRNPPRITRLPG